SSTSRAWWKGPRTLPGEAAALPSRDRVLGLACTVRAAAEAAQLLREEHGLVLVRPGQEDGLVTEQLHPDRLLGLGSQRQGAVGARTGVARAGPSDRAVGDDAVVPVSPLDSERIPPHLLQSFDVRALAHASPVDEGTVDAQQRCGAVD